MPAHILIVEDEAPLREQIVEILELEGYRVDEAENGGIALGLLQHIKPDLVVCDIAMPDYNGYQILEHIRNDQRLARTPFIFVTARAERTDIRKGMEYGADDYLTKPFTHDELLSSIKSRLARFDSLKTKGDEVLESAKKKLTHMVVHELRTPLISMAMAHEVISKKLDDLSTEDMRDLLQMMQSGNQRLQHVVEQMVFFTRLNTGVLNQEIVKENGRSVELESLIRDGIEAGRKYGYRNQDAAIKRLKNKPRATIHCIAKALSFAFAELITNALIYSPEGADVIIQEQLDDDCIYISILDSGPGFSTGRLEKASLPFEQIDRENQEQQGMGMGIPLAIKIVEVHGGTLRIQSTSKGGTKVIVMLPLAS